MRPQVADLWSRCLAHLSRASLRSLAGGGQSACWHQRARSAGTVSAMRAASILVLALVGTGTLALAAVANIGKPTVNHVPVPTPEQTCNPAHSARSAGERTRDRTEFPRAWRLAGGSSRACFGGRERRETDPVSTLAHGLSLAGRVSGEREIVSGRGDGPVSIFASLPFPTLITGDNHEVEARSTVRRRLLTSAFCRVDAPRRSSEPRINPQAERKTPILRAKPARCGPVAKSIKTPLEPANRRATCSDPMHRSPFA